MSTPRPELIDHEGVIYISVRSVTGAISAWVPRIRNEFPPTVTREDVAEGFEALATDLEEMHTRVDPEEIVRTEFL